MPKWFQNRRTDARTPARGSRRLFSNKFVSETHNLIKDQAILEFHIWVKRIIHETDKHEYIYAFKGNQRS